MFQYKYYSCLEHLTSTRLPSPRMAPQTINFWLNFFVGLMQLGWIREPFLRRIYFLVFGCKSNLHSSENMTEFHLVSVHNLLSRHHLFRICICFFVKHGFLTAILPNKPACLSVHLTVSIDTSWMLFSCINSLAVLSGECFEFVTNFLTFLWLKSFKLIF